MNERRYDCRRTGPVRSDTQRIHRKHDMSLNAGEISGIANSHSTHTADSLMSPSSDSPDPQFPRES